MSTQSLDRARAAKASVAAVEKLLAGDVVGGTAAVMQEVVALTSAKGWDTWKRLSVNKYVQTVVLNMTPPELVDIHRDGKSLEHIIAHAAAGFDKWQGRRRK